MSSQATSRSWEVEASRGRSPVQPALDGRLAVPRPWGRALQPDELEVYAQQLALRPELWIDHVVHDPRQRQYRELVHDEHITAWLICWMQSHDTGFHDHDVSAGAVMVVGGRVCEERLSLAGAPTRAVYSAGQSFYFSAADIHRVRHHGKDPAVTLHVYSPPLLRMGNYSVNSAGILERHPSPTNGQEPESSG
jgi:Cysteine dioxygenase type I